MTEESRMYLFNYLPLDKSLQVKDEKKKTLFTICRGKSFFLDVFYEDGTRKEGLTVEDVLNLIPDASINTVRYFAGFIYLFARGL